MICRVCLKDENVVLQIFDTSGTELSIANVLGKYFWFEPREDDPISKVICKICWTKIDDFHQFYLEIEEAHRLLTERFSVKQEKNHKLHILNETSNKSRKTKDITTDSSNRSLDINPILNDSGGSAVLEDKSFSLFTTTEHTCEEEEFYANDEESFNGERFMEKLLSDGNTSTFESDRKTEPLTDNSKRRVTRANTSFKKPVTEFDSTLTRVKKETNEKYALNSNTRKRRGRPPKSKENIIFINKNNQNKIENINLEETKPRENKNDQDLKIKNDEIDIKIAQHVRLLCDVCTEQLPTFAELRNHMIKIHHCKGYAICCNKKFYKRVLLSDHIAKHINPECYKCQDCDKIFADKQCMRNHFLLKHQPEESKVFQCEHCSKKFAKSYLLEQHRIVHEDRKHICIICQKRFPAVNLLTTHMKLAHENYGTMCDICAKVIRGRASFKRHQLEHEGVVPPKVQCDKCGSWHKNKYSLQKHKRRHNEEGTLHICDICNKIAPNRSALLSHIRYVHAAERSYNCGVCEKSFKKSINLKEHMATHTGEVLYKCPHCTKTFNSNANMHSHRKKVHPKEFEEYRKDRLTAKAKSIPIVPIQTAARQGVSSNLHPTTTTASKSNNKNNSNEIESEQLPKILTIQTGENGETRQVIVTSEDYDANDNENNENIIFTIS